MLPYFFLLPKAGLCGGSYYRTAAVLDAFSDERLGNRKGNIRLQLLDGLRFASVTKLVGQSLMIHFHAIFDLSKLGERLEWAEWHQELAPVRK